MSLFLKSVWRNALRGSMASLRSMSSSLAEATSSRPPDLIMANIKSAPSPIGLLESIQKYMGVMTHKHMLQALRSLFEMQKTGKFDHEAYNIVKDPGFGVLCQNIKKNARAFEVNEAIEATKVLSYLKVPVDTLVVQTMLQMIRCNINKINLQQIMFLDFVLRQFDRKNHLVDALKLALPLVFQIHLPMELDNQDLPLLTDMLRYSCTHDMPDRCINNVVTALLLHDQAIDAKVARSIVWSLCEVNCKEDEFPTRVQLLHICCDILTQSLDDLSYNDVVRMAAKLKGRVLARQPEFYHEQLMDSVADYVVRHDLDFEKGLLVARVLSRMAHTHLGLIEHLCQQAVSSPVMIANARTNILFGFINCLANNNYLPEPDQWQEIRRQISLNPVFNVTSTALPWAKVCLELACLGHYEDKILSRVFSQDFLDEFLSRENNLLDYLQLLTLHEAVNTFHSQEYKLPAGVFEKAKSMYPTHSMTDQLEEYMARGIGGSEYICKNVMLPCGFVADLLMFLKGGYPLKLPERGGDIKVPIEQLNLPQGGVVVCLMNFSQGCFSMNSNRLRGMFRLILDIMEKQGYAAVAVNINEWLNAPSHERTPYLMREVGYKCGEFGMKLCAT